MQQQPELAAKHLLETDSLVIWIAEIDSNIAVQARTDQEAHRERPSLAVFAVGMACDPSLPLYLADGTIIEGLEAVVEAFDVARDRRAAELVSEENLERLALWLRRRHPPDADLSEGVARVRKLGAAPAVKLAELVWRLDPARPLKLLPGLNAKDKEDVPRLAFGKAAGWKGGLPESYLRTLVLYREGYLTAWLRARGFDETASRAEDLLAKLAGHETAAFESTLPLLDSSLAPVGVRVDRCAASSTSVVAFGKTGSRRLKFTTDGPGVPFAAVTSSNARPGLRSPDQPR